MIHLKRNGKAMTIPTRNPDRLRPEDFIGGKLFVKTTNDTYEITNIHAASDWGQLIADIRTGGGPFHRSLFIVSYDKGMTLRVYSGLGPWTNVPILYMLGRRAA